ncbi:LOW QUALITY PROTEIN: integrin alpha-5-like [Chiloscyllium punctatum]|uniref:LOW QUALITY PROTEIN: integrin alpha-5-like n=1 Tax=Chiloscyllium punctatum TaxID=137246 RepID=UPI003B63F983
MSSAAGDGRPLAGLLHCSLALVLCSRSLAYNLDSSQPSVYSGPQGSYFGFSVEFYVPDPATPSVLVGAPKANTSQPNITEAGAVYSCAWDTNGTDCVQLPFDLTGNRLHNETEVLEFKSNQWFGASIRSSNRTIVACAPRYRWRGNGELRELVGTCYLSLRNFSDVLEYAPCRTKWHTPAGQGYCQGGFSADLTENGRVVLGGPGSFYWQGQLLSANIENIVPPQADFSYIQYTVGEIYNKQSESTHDDSYLGYSVAVGEFSGDSVEDYVTGVPRGLETIGYVRILNGTNMETIFNFSGEQMASYFGYAVAVTDINNDGLDDVLVGAPMYMERVPGGRLQEVGRVYVYLQTGLLEYKVHQNLTGTDIYGRYGTSVAGLRDLDQDGFNDVAVGAPYAGDKSQGLVYIYNGRPDGLNSTPSQILVGMWASATSVPASFGFSARGAMDLDMNGYPDVIVGAFGVDRAVVYRARPIVWASASLKVSPPVFNPEEKGCTINGTDIQVTCINVSFCLSASGKHVPEWIGFKVELELDSLKQTGAIKRVLFLDSRQPLFQDRVAINNGHGEICQDLKIYLQEEHEFRDKLSLIQVAMTFSLDPTMPLDNHGLQPILSYSTREYLTQEAQIQLDCGDDNVCVPDLQLSVNGERKTVYHGDDNPLTLIFEARNLGEGGAYEAELHVFVPTEAEYSGIVRNESLAKLSCTYSNETVVCDLGNPMKSGAELCGGLRFTVPHLHGDKKSIEFELQIRSKNLNNSRSDMVPYKLEVEVEAHISTRGAPIPKEVLFATSSLKPEKEPITEEDVGPPVKYVFEVSNNGPSSISHSILHVTCPVSYQNERLLYLTEYKTVGPVLNCTVSSSLNPLQLKLQSPPVESARTLNVSSEKPEHSIRRREAARKQLGDLESLSCQHVGCLSLICEVGLLSRGANVVLEIRTRVWAHTFLQRQHQPFTLPCNASYQAYRMPYRILPKDYPTGSLVVSTPVMWIKPESSYSVPLWIIILAVLVGLLLLALLIFILYKLGFFKRAKLPHGTAMETAHLKPQATSEA